MCRPTLTQADWISPSRRIGTELRDYDRMPFTNTSSTQVSFYTYCPASCLLHVFLFGRPRSATPPWSDGDLRRLHNGGLCALSEWQTCPYKLLGTPHPHPATQTHKQLGCITGFFRLLGSSVPWFTRQTDMTKGFKWSDFRLPDRNVLTWQLW